MILIDMLNKPDNDDAKNKFDAYLKEKNEFIIHYKEIIFKLELGVLLQTLLVVLGVLLLPTHLLSWMLLTMISSALVLMTLFKYHLNLRKFKSFDNWLKVNS